MEVDAAAAALEAAKTEHASQVQRFHESFKVKIRRMYNSATQPPV